MSHIFEKRCEARRSEIRAGSVLAHVTKRVAAITPPRAHVVLRFLPNNPPNPLCIRPKLTTRSLPNSYIRSAEIGEIFGLTSPRILGDHGVEQHQRFASGGLDSCRDIGGNADVVVVFQ